MMFNAQAAQLFLVVAIFSRLWPTVVNMQASMEQIATTIPSFKAVIALQKESKIAREFEISNESSVTPLKVEHHIACEQLSFRYDRNKAYYALQNINIRIPVNQMTAFVGPSGAGKSTLIDMLMGLNKPEEGNVLIDGITLNNEEIIAFRKSLWYFHKSHYLFNML